MQNLPNQSKTLRSFRLLATAAMLTLVLGINASAAVTLARATVDKLNVRNAPNGSILFTLPVDSIVALKEQKPGWSKIIYLTEEDPESAKTGWVSADFLKSIDTNQADISDTELDGDSCGWDYKYLSRTCLIITDADLSCQKADDGRYYSSCQVEISYELISNLQGKGSLDSEIKGYSELEIRARGG